MASDSRQEGGKGPVRPVEKDSVSYLRKGFTSLKRADWTTFGALAIIVVLGAYLRFYFDFMQSIAGGFPSLSGGSDADFYFNVITYALSTGHQMLYDPLLNFPIGSFNPFLPFYVWSNVLLAWPISFLFHIPLTGSIYTGQMTAAVVAYSSMSALSGVGAIIATYYLGKELFSKEAGIIAAALMAFLPSIVSESTAGFGVHDPFVLMLTAVVFFFLFRALNTINGLRWVERWNRKDSYLPDVNGITAGIAKYYRDNKTSLLYATLAGLVLAGIANAWEGYSYIIVVIALFYLVQSFIYKFKNRDTLALTAIFSVMGSVLMILAMPVYYNSHAVYPWFYVSFVFFLGTLIVGLIYTVGRDVPWLTLLTALVATVLVVVGVVELADPKILHSILQRVLTAQSYFIKSSVYTTIAEAQTPPFSLLALSLGSAVFFIAFAQLAYMVYRYQRALDNSKLLLIIWFIISSFMAVSTVRFVLDATTTFVLLAGEGIYALVRWVDFSEIRKGFQTYGTSWSGTRKSIKLKHILVALFIAFVVVLPVVWTGIDAATPSNTKNSLNSQVYNILPGFLRPSGYVLNSTASPYYFGAFGYSLETPSTYFIPAWEYLNNYTQNITPYSARPGYLSWWDYGSAAVTFAQVPTVADDFQQGYQLASAFLFSQNQTQAISLLVARVLDGANAVNHNSLPQNLTGALTSYGINASYVQDVLSNPGSYTGIVLANPGIYGPFAPSVTSTNVKYAVLMATISKIGLDNVVSLYQRVSQLTGNFIGFFSVDARLFPFSATNTGVFYAPAFLGGRPIAGPGVYNVPYNYYTLSATTTTGISYPIQSIPAGSLVTAYNINYQPMFYNMTLYRLFMGYSAYDITGQNLSGVPGLSGSFLSSPQLSRLSPLPGWMMSHFEMIYRTAYYNPYPLKYVQAHPNSWVAISYQKALSLANADPTFSKYTVDLSPQSDFQNGIVMLAYYPGAFVNGTVLTSNGQPASGIRVTVLDQWGIPHDVTYTNSQGRYSAIALRGNDTIIYSTGMLTTALQNVTQIGTILKQTNITVTNSQAMRSPTLNTSTGLPVYNINMGVTTLSQTSVTGHLFFNTPKNTTYTPGVTPPLLNVSVELVNTSSGLNYTTWAPSGVYSFSSVLPGIYNVVVQSGSARYLAKANLTVPYGFTTPQDLSVNPSYVVGTVSRPGGLPVGGVGISLSGNLNNYSAKVTSAANGTYSFSSLLPGNYTVYVSSGGYTSSHYTVEAAPLNYTKNHPGTNLTALLETTVEGTVTLGGSPVPYDTLYFYSGVAGISPFETMTNANGHYSLMIGAGKYTVYSSYYLGSVPYSLLAGESFRGGAAQYANYSLSEAYPVSGTVKGTSNIPAGYNNVNVQAGSSSINITTNSSGGFSLLLPGGTYGIWTYGGGGAYLGQFTVTGKTNVQVSDLASATYSGIVKTTISGFEENITGAVVSFSYGGFTYSSLTSLTGHFSIMLPGSLSVPAQISSAGMIASTVSLSSGSQGFRTVSMVPEEVFLNGSISNGVTLPSGTELTLTASNGTTVSIPFNSGSYSATIGPGIYNVSFTGYNDSAIRYTLTSAQSRLTVPVGNNTVFNPAAIPAYNMTIYFTYPASSGISNSTPLTRIDIFSSALPQPMVLDNFKNGGSVYLSASAYTVYSYSVVNSSAFSFLNRISIQSAISYSLNMKAIANLSGTVYYGNRTLGSATVYITGSNGASIQAAVQSDGSFSVSLPPSSYTVNASYVSTANVSGESRYVIYYGQSSVNLTSQSNIRVQTSYRAYNSTVSGTANWFYNLPVQSLLKFIAVSGTAISARINTTGSGTYSLSLAPGNYTVETYSSNGQASNVTRIEVTPGVNATFNPVLYYAYLVQGNASVAGIGNVPATITIAGSGGSFSISAGSNGYYSVPLPQGNYTVSASYNMTVDGTDYVYNYSSAVHVTSPAEIPLLLTLQPTYSVTLTILSAQHAQGSTGFTQVSLLVNNTGDVPDIFYLSVDTAKWYGSFNPTYVVLGTGRNSSAVVNATLSSSNPAGGFNNVYFSASSLISTANASASTSVKVPVSYGFSTAFSSYGTEKVGRTITFSVVVSNTGNTVSNFVASVSDLQELKAEGWSGGIYTTSNGPFYNSTFFSLKPNQNQTLTVQLTASAATPSIMLPVGINVTQKETGASYSLNVPISLPRPVVTLNGISVTGQGASAIPPPIISAKRAVIIFILASLIVASVYFAKKRRLIR